MAELPSQITNWVYNVLQPQYVHKETAYSHLYFFLRRFLPQGFRIRTRVFTSAASGTQNLLINLYGDLRVAAGDVPVEIWVPLNYPYSDANAFEGENGVPMVFVTPDNQKHQYLRPGNYVDSQGKVYHPYLTRWFQNSVEGNSAAANDFNLIELCNMLSQIFDQQNPVFVSETSPGPSLPAKPAKVSLGASSSASPAQSPGPSAQPPQPQSSIPLKYQAPLPLPTAVSPRNVAVPLSNQGTGAMSRQSTGSSQNSSLPRYSHAAPPLRSPPQQLRSPPQTHAAPVVRPQATRPVQPPTHSRTTSIDLMDRDDSQTGPGANPVRAQILQQLSDAINRCLTEMPENSPELFTTINTNSAKVNGLYDQLKHHNTQASANKDNLQQHLNYLVGQVAAITKLNQELAHLDRLNNDDPQHIYTSTTNKIDLDEIIVPDSVLTNQLYELVSDIKATKDTIGLVSGGFGSQKEIINDANFDQCVKSVRSLGRDLFWMELTKLDIGKKMHLEPN